MMQLNLFDVEPLIATYDSNRPLRAMEAIQREIDNRNHLRRHHQHQEKLPPCLRNDQWTIYKDPDGYRIFHSYTALETCAHTIPSDAISEALHIAAFFGLLPFDDLQRMAHENPLIFSKPPQAIAARYKYGSFDEEKWVNEYRQRHLMPPFLPKALAQKLLVGME